MILMVVEITTLVQQHLVCSFHVAILKSVEFTYMTTWLPYKTACGP